MLHSRSTMPRLPIVSWSDLVTVTAKCKWVGKHGWQTEGSLTIGVTDGMLTAAFATGFCGFFQTLNFLNFVLG